MVFEKLRTILAEQFEVDAETITPNTALDEDLGADSLDVVDVLMSIEDTFSVEIPDEEIEKLRTVADVVAYIEEHL
jgi:acyl carrier protein